jgi:hypothetical protein
MLRESGVLISHPESLIANNTRLSSKALMLRESGVLISHPESLIANNADCIQSLV